MKCISATSLLLAAILTWKLLIRRANKTTAWPASHGALLGKKAQLPEKTMRLRVMSTGSPILKSNFKWKNTYLWNYLCPDCKVIAALHAENKYILNWWKLIKIICKVLLLWYPKSKQAVWQKDYICFLPFCFQLIKCYLGSRFVYKKQPRTITEWLYLSIWRMFWYLLHKTFFQDIFNISRLTQTQCTGYIFRAHCPCSPNMGVENAPFCFWLHFQCCSVKPRTFPGPLPSKEAVVHHNSQFISIDKALCWRVLKFSLFHQFCQIWNGIMAKSYPNSQHSIILGDLC